MTTALDLINTTKRYLLASHREVLNTLKDPITDVNATSINFTQTTQAIDGGAYLSVDLEIMYVWRAASGNSAVVERGMLGSTRATHAAGALVTVNPKFPDFSIFTELNHDLADLSGQGLYRPMTVDIPYISGRMGYEIDLPDVLGGIDVSYDYPGISQDWPRLSHWEIRNDVDLTEFPSGIALILKESAYAGRNVRVTLAVPYSPLTALTSSVETVAGLQDSALDLPPLGAAQRLQGLREGQANFNESQPASRRTNEIPPGSQLTGTRALIDFRRSRILSEKNKLHKKFPYRRIVQG